MDFRNFTHVNDKRRYIVNGVKQPRFKRKCYLCKTFKSKGKGGEFFVCEECNDKREDGRKNNGRKKNN